MLVSTEGHRGYRFGDFMLDLDRGALLREGEEVALRPKSFEVLRYLVEHQGTLVTREELLAHAWPDVIVTDDSLTQCLIEIRRALGDEDRTLVRTVPRRGFIFELPVERTHAEPDRASRRADHHASNLAWLLGAVTVLIGAAIGWWALSGGPKTQDGPVTGPRDPAFSPPAQSIAVLAFADLSPAGDQAWFAEGLAEEVLNLLAQVPELHVIARTSSFTFRDSNADIRTIAERLNVAHVLEGSVRRDGERVRITAQLVDGVTETHVWSHSYDRTMDDVFGVQEQIAGQVAELLQVELAPGPTPPSTDPDPEAWAAYLHGQFFWKRQGPGDIQRAEQSYREALRLDPAMARAWAGLSAVYMYYIYDGRLERSAGLAMMGEAAENALRLAPEDPTVLARVARYRQWSGRPEEAEALWDEALRRDPHNVLALSMSAGNARDNRDFERAVELERRVAQLDPFGGGQYNLANSLLAAGQLEEASRELRQVAESRSSSRNDALSDLALIECLLGRPTEALAVLDGVPPSPDAEMARVIAHESLNQPRQAQASLDWLLADERVISAMNLARVHAWRGDKQRAVQWLDIALDRVTPGAPWSESWRPISLAGTTPLLQGLEGDPAYEQWWQRVREQKPTWSERFASAGSVGDPH